MTTQIVTNDNGFAPLIRDGICLACFNTPWSAPCRAQIEILDKLAARYGDRLKLLDVNVDYLEQVRARFGVDHIPTLILFRRGMECHRLVGVHPETALCRAIDAELMGAAG